MTAAPSDGEIAGPVPQWRCFFCDETFTRREDAAEHFGTDNACETDAPACRIAAHEGHLVHYIRKLEAELRRYQSEDSDVMRSIMSLEADHATALKRAEEKGYARGLGDYTKDLAAARREARVAAIEECAQRAQHCGCSSCGEIIADAIRALLPAPEPTQEPS